MLRSLPAKAAYSGPVILEHDLEGIVIGCVVSMIGAVGPSLDASRTTAGPRAGSW